MILKKFFVCWCCSFFFTSLIAQQNGGNSKSNKIERFCFKSVKKNYSSQITFQRTQVPGSNWLIKETTKESGSSNDSSHCQKMVMNSTFGKKFMKQCLRLISEDSNTICLSEQYEMIRGDAKKYSVATPASDFSLHGGEVYTLELLLTDSTIYKFNFFDPKHAIVECINDRNNRKRFLDIEKKIKQFSCKQSE